MDIFDEGAAIVILLHTAHRSNVDTYAKTH